MLYVDRNNAIYKFCTAKDLAVGDIIVEFGFYPYCSYSIQRMTLIRGKGYAKPAMEIICFPYKRYVLRAYDGVWAIKRTPQPATLAKFPPQSAAPAAILIAH